MDHIHDLKAFVYASASAYRLFNAGPTSILRIVISNQENFSVGIDFNSLAASHDVGILDSVVFSYIGRLNSFHPTTTLQKISRTMTEIENLAQVCLECQLAWTLKSIEALKPGRNGVEPFPSELRTLSRPTTMSKTEFSSAERARVTRALTYLKTLSLIGNHVIKDEDQHPYYLKRTAKAFLAPVPDWQIEEIVGVCDCLAYLETAFIDQRLLTTMMSIRTDRVAFRSPAYELKALKDCSDWGASGLATSSTAPWLWPTSGWLYCIAQATVRGPGHAHMPLRLPFRRIGIHLWDRSRLIRFKLLKSFWPWGDDVYAANEHFPTSRTDLDFGNYPRWALRTSWLEIWFPILLKASDIEAALAIGE